MRKLRSALGRLCLALDRLFASRPLAAAVAAAPGLTDAQILQAVAELSAENPKALEAARATLSGMPPEGAQFNAWLPEGRAFAALANGLDKGPGIAWLDWAVGVEEAGEAFAEVFAAVGLDPEGPLGSMQQPRKRGDGVAQAYVAFRQAADATGWRWIGLNDGSDAYFLTLVPETAAERWSAVAYSAQGFLENPDWQFAALLAAQGVTPRSTMHPVDSPRQPPADLSGD